MKPFALLSVFLGGFLLALNAQPTNTSTPQANRPPTVSSQTNKPIILPPISVTAKTNRNSLTSPSIADAERKKKQIAGGLTIQAAEDLNKTRASSLDDLLQNAPGLIMLSENEVDVSKIYLRGYGVIQEDEPSGVEYLLDGLSLNQADGEMIIEDLDVGTFKYAEIYRGADALQYGGLELGGAVNFVPFTGYDASPLTLKTEGGSFGFTRSEISSGGVDGPFDYYVSVSARYREGWRDHSRENTELLFGDFGYKFNDHLENRVYLTVDQTGRQIPGALTLQQMESNPRQIETTPGTPDANPVTQDWRKDWYYFRFADKLSYEAGPEQAEAGAYWWHRQAFEPNIYIPDNTLAGIGSFYADDFGGRLNSATRWDWLGGENILTLGLNPTIEDEHDSYHENLNGSEGALTGKDGELSLNGVLYGQLQHYLTDKLSISLGVQGIYAQRHFSDLFNTSVDGNASQNLVYLGINPKFGLIYELNDKNQLFASFNRAYQPPSFDDMVDFDTGPNTSQEFTPLEAQTAWTAEVGTRGEQGPFKWELSLYHAWVRHELVDVFSAETDLDLGSLNIAHSMHQGVEASLEWRLLDSLLTKANKTRGGDQLTFRQDFTLTDAHFRHDPAFGNDRIAGVPIYDYQAQLMYESPFGFYAGPNLHWVITRFPVDNANTLDCPAYVLLGFRAGMDLGKGLSIFFDARNLLDQRYASSVDPISSAAAFEPTVQVFHPGDPRAFYGGMAYRW